MLNTREMATEYRLTHWTEVIRRRVESRQSKKGFCEAEGIHQNVYHNWQRKLREAAVKEILPMQTQTAAAVPSGWTQISTEAEREKAEIAGISIEIGKMRVKAQADSDMELLLKVCKALTEIC